MPESIKTNYTFRLTVNVRTNGKLVITELENAVKGNNTVNEIRN